MTSTLEPPGGQESPEPYDSRADTLAHIEVVRSFLRCFARELLRRADVHDASKLEDPEKAGFDEFTPKLRAMTYGSAEYTQALADLGAVLTHHYEHNSHHPEHYANGFSGMNLPDVVEMFCDWAAAVQRHDDGNLRRSIAMNAERFGYDEQVEVMLVNTLGAFEGAPD